MPIVKSGPPAKKETRQERKKRRRDILLSNREKERKSAEQRSEKRRDKDRLELATTRARKAGILDPKELPAMTREGKLTTLTDVEEAERKGKEEADRKKLIADVQAETGPVSGIVPPEGTVRGPEEGVRGTEEFPRVVSEKPFNIADSIDQGLEAIGQPILDRMPEGFIKDILSKEVEVSVGEITKDVALLGGLRGGFEAVVKQSGKVGLKFGGFKKIEEGFEILKRSAKGQTKIGGDTLRITPKNFPQNGVGAIKTNPKTKKQSMSLLTKVGFGTLAVSAIISAAGSYPWAFHNKREAVDSLTFGMKQALEEEDLETYEEEAELMREILNPQGWNAIWANTPVFNVVISSQNGINAAIVVAKGLAKKAERIRKGLPSPDEERFDPFRVRAERENLEAEFPRRDLQFG